MARTFNGSTDHAESASALSLSSPTKISVAWWMYIATPWPTDNNRLAAYGVDVLGTNAFSINAGAGATDIRVHSSTDGSLFAGRDFAHPSVDAWHHYVLTMDRAVAGAATIVALWIDGSSQSPANVFTDTLTGAFTNEILNIGWSGLAFFLSARIAEVALWPGINFSQTDVDNLYNAGAGALATAVQSGSLAYYWRILGDASPEPATTGGIDLTVTGTSQVAHPFEDAPPATAVTHYVNMTADP